MNFKTFVLLLVIFNYTNSEEQSEDSMEFMENASSGSPYSLEEEISPSVKVHKRAPFGGSNSFEDFRDLEDEDESKETVRTSPSQNRPPYNIEDNYPTVHLRNQIPISQPKPQPKPIQQQQQQYIQQTAPPIKSRSQTPSSSYYKKQSNLKKLEEEEEQLPDRLTELLPKSNFNCVNRQTGYYADESLGCEVFHYCQENARHSWICPEGFLFHQVHLICMPPGKDNICSQSSRFHVVNDYLYKPINLEEHQNRPNVTLRYSERYYPEEYHQHYLADNDYDEEPQQRKQTVINNQYQTQVIRRPTQAPQYQISTIRPQTNIGQVYRSAEDINISLEQRRPPQYFSPRYFQQQQQQ